MARACSATAIRRWAGTASRYCSCTRRTFAARWSRSSKRRVLVEHDFFRKLVPTFRDHALMAWTTAAAIYFVIWWVVLFTVLPFSVRNAAEAGETVEPGHDPGAPTVPALKAKLVWTTVVSAVVFGICWVIYVYRLVAVADPGTLGGVLGWG